MNFIQSQMNIGVLLYWGLYLISATLIVSLIFVVIINLPLFNDSQGKIKSYAVILLILFIAFLPGVINYYLIPTIGFQAPPLQIQESVAPPPENREELKGKIGSLKQLLSSPESLTIAELITITKDTLSLTAELQSRAAEREKIISELKTELELERQKSREAENLAKEIQSITQEELQAVKLLISKDAKKEAEKSFYLGIVISFPLGILASLIAPFCYSKLGFRKKQNG